MLLHESRLSLMDTPNFIRGYCYVTPPGFCCIIITKALAKDGFWICSLSLFSGRGDAKVNIDCQSLTTNLRSGYSFLRRTPFLRLMNLKKLFKQDIIGNILNHQHILATRRVFRNIE